MSSFPGTDVFTPAITPKSYMAVTNGHNSIFLRLRLWVEHQSLRDELHTLSDRELTDIGISRADISRLVPSWHH